jgi:hypothetical protein
MTVAELAEILVRVLAVWGLYCILRSVVSFFVDRRRMSVGVHIEDGDSVYETFCALKGAQVLTEGKSVFESTPVLLCERKIPDDLIEEYERLGAEIYYNHTVFKDIGLRTK